ncbi:MAG: glycosyltransferase family 4 protein [Stellaceae bacterium]
MRPLRILTFSTLYPNEAQPHHGIFVENRLRHLVASGEVESVVVAPVPYFPFRSSRFGHWATFARCPETEQRHGISVHHPRYVVVPRIGMNAAPALLAAGVWRTVQRLHQIHDFDLVDAHYAYPDGVAAAWLGRRLRLPVVVTVRGTDINLIPRLRFPRYLIRRSLRRVAGVIAVSEALRDAVIEIGGAPDLLTVLRNGVDLDLFRPIEPHKARHNLALDGPTLLSVGHLIERKGHDLAIRALALLPEYRLLIVGDGPERAALGQLATALGVHSRVRFLGPKPHDKLPAIYSAVDALVLASTREGWPNVLLEAMACGTPVVASNVWGNPEVVRSPAAGRLMEERSATGVAQAVRALLSSGSDRGVTRRYAEGFSWDETSRGQIALFRRILGHSNADAGLPAASSVYSDPVG